MINKRAIKTCLEVASCLSCLDDAKQEYKEYALKRAFAMWIHVHDHICDQLSSLQKEQAMTEQKLEELLAKILNVVTDRITQLEREKAAIKAITRRTEAAEGDWQLAEKGIKQLKRAMAELKSVWVSNRKIRNQQAEEIKRLKQRLDAVEGLLSCYRLGRYPSEKLLRELDKTKDALTKP